VLVDDPRPVMRVIRSVFAVVLTVALLAGQVTVCAGWSATPAARMACCVEDASCPMQNRPTNEVTQAQADSCCAFSEGHQPSPTGETAAMAITHAVLGPQTVVPARAPARVLSDGWRTAIPVPSPPIPRHILLSVFLV
jgi:hypothetical protein